MKPGDREYDALVQRKLRELRGEGISGEAIEGTLILPADFTEHKNTVVLSEPKRRGRPPGSKNKPKA